MKGILPSGRLVSGLGISNFWIEIQARVKISYKNGPMRDYHLRIQVGIMLESTFFQILK
jgi:hypothetical protein